MPVTGAGERLHGTDLPRPQAELGGRGPPRPFLLPVPGTLPAHQDAVAYEQRRRVLAQNGERRDGSRSDDTVGPSTAPASPVLGSRWDGSSVRGSRRGGQALDNRTLPARGLDQVDAGVRQRDRQREAGEPGARADIGDRGRLSDERQLKPGQAVGDVETDRPLGIDDGRRRVGLGGERAQQAPDPPAGRRRESVALG